MLKTNLAAACGAVIYFLTHVPYVIAYVRDAKSFLALK